MEYIVQHQFSCGKSRGISFSMMIMFNNIMVFLRYIDFDDGISPAPAQYMCAGERLREVVVLHSTQPRRSEKR